MAKRLSGSYDRSLIEGPLRSAVWKLAWPTIVVNVIGGFQGLIDNVLVGHFVGYKGNAAISISWQIFIFVIVFISSTFIGMSVLVSRFVGADDPDKVNRVVYQAFLTAMFLSFVVLGPVGYLLSPFLLGFVSASPDVIKEALPFLRISFAFSGGMLIFFMLGGALRAAGDARTPMVLGVVTTLLNILFNVILIKGLGPIPAFGTKGAAMGTAIAFGLVAVYSLWRLWHGGWVVEFPRHHGLRPDWDIILQLFKFGLPAGFQGIAMNLGGIFMARFIGHTEHGAEAQAAFGIAYSQLFSFITWTSQALLGASATVAGQNLGAHNPQRANDAVHAAARIGLYGAAAVGVFFLVIPRQLFAAFGMTDATVLDIGAQLLRILGVSGLFITVALTYTGGLQGTGDTKSPMWISIISQIIIPIGICFTLQQIGTLQPIHIWVAILIGHMTRCTLSVIRFNQGEWRKITVRVGKDDRAAAAL
ncbi:MAG TPA: MATE family efflux transporter [Gemmatimonadaceae bacterium]|nr:MATE family efflux transporter [Gemmatimonadaceae bacterium]